MLDIVQLQQEIRTFVQERDWEPYHTPKNLAIALSVEVSELLELFQWMTDAEQARIHEDHRLLGEIAEEFADSMIYLLRFADVLGLEVEQAVRDKIARNQLKYPVETAGGRFVKYSRRNPAAAADRGEESGSEGKQPDGGL